MNKKGEGSCIACLEGKHVYLGVGRKSPMFDLGNLFFFFLIELCPFSEKW